MSTLSDIDILVSEVGPRDGLQSIDAVLPTEVKNRWISAQAAAGCREIEVGSFVPPKLLPQLADTADVVRGATDVAGLTVAVLVPNLKGAQNAVATGVDDLIRQRSNRRWIVSATSCESMIAPSTIASGESGVHPSRVT